MKRWHIAKSKLQMAAWLTSSFASMDIDVFYPKVSREKRGKAKIEPLFPNYIFCHFDPDVVDWNSIRWSPGLDCFLGTSEHPSEVTYDVVEYIKRRVEETNRPQSKEPKFDHHPISFSMTDALASLEEVFDRKANSKRRCKILLETVGFETRVEASRAGSSVVVPSVQAPIDNSSLRFGHIFS